MLYSAGQLFSFTTLGSSGRQGPYDATGYKGTLLESVQILAGLQQWFVPVSGRYQVTACGAPGGAGENGTAGGNGAKADGVVRLVEGTVLVVLVGQRGQCGGPPHVGSGGGGTFVTYRNNTPLVVVGGGGGGYIERGEPGQALHNGSVYGGRAGSGGKVCMWGSNKLPDGGSGGGLTGSGCCFDKAPCVCVGNGKAGRGYHQGGEGGASSSDPFCDGGFGGGGACQSTPGGGGGYSGGGATEFKGGGGGSFNLSSAWNITAGQCQRHGYVTFRYISP